MGYPIVTVADNHKKIPSIDKKRKLFTACSQPNKSHSDVETKNVIQEDGIPLLIITGPTLSPVSLLC